MALAVAHTMQHGGSLVVEAGTGVGKTFAYLVPALLSGERILVSTATKTLQDQLYARDIPELLQALGLPLRLAMLKGRGSYLCQQRLELTQQAATLPDRQAVKILSQVQVWSRTTTTGDLAEVPGLDERSALIPLITSNRDNCLGSTCPHWRDCHVNAARREAMQPMSLSSTTICFLQTWPCVNRAWLNCCRQSGLSSLMRRTNSMKRASNF